jgi:hypothetical protein
MANMTIIIVRVTGVMIPVWPIARADASSRFGRFFEKAGEPGWAAIIPFYNLYVLFKITWVQGWKFLLMLIPIANFVIAIITMVKLAKAFGKSGGFAVGLIFLSVIFYCILAFDNSINYIGVPTGD